MSAEQQITEMAVTPSELYHYIKQPWRWHEWHPNSSGATASFKDPAGTELKIGDTFQENFEIKLFSFLPFKTRSLINWTVIADREPSYWEIEGISKSAHIRFKYDFVPCAKGVAFTRSLDFELKGFLRLLDPIIRRRNIKMSNLAVTNMVKVVDAGIAPK
jgi:hypothetical protein